MSYDKVISGSVGERFNTLPGVLVIDEELPYPANTGKRIRTQNLLRRLSSDFAIDYLVHESGANEESIRFFAEHNICVHTAGSSISGKRGLLFPFKIAANLLSSKPYSVNSHTKPPFARRIKGLVRTGRYQLVHCEWSPYANYYDYDGTPWIISAHNVEYMIWQRLTENERNPLKRAVFGAQAIKMKRFEREIFSTLRYFTAVSEDDACLMKKLGCKDVAVVSNGVDIDYFASQDDAVVEPKSLVFTGSMDWLANQSAIRWFAEEIHPRLKDRVDYRLYVVGRNPPDWMTASGGVPSEFVITGTVDDVRPYIARSSVYVVPLLVGGGSRLKILEALSMRKAIVSTSVGAEGLEVEDGRELVLADGPDEFVNAIVTLLDNEPQRKRLGEYGEALVHENYEWGQLARRQAEFWSKVIDATQSAPAAG